MINGKRVIAFLAIGAAAVAFTRVFVKKESPAKAVKNTVTEPVKTLENAAKAAVGAAETVVKKTRRFVKGSPEAKEYMAKMREKAKGVKKGEGKRARKKSKKSSFDYQLTDAEAEKESEIFHQEQKSKKHKGHSSKRGLAQDQKLESSESWEKSYRKQRG